MQFLQVEGGIPLYGTVEASGSKIAISKLIIASMISGKSSLFYNVPVTADVIATLRMCQEVGMEYTFDKDAGVLNVCTEHIRKLIMTDVFSGSNRFPILMVGALLSRAAEEIVVPLMKTASEDWRPYDFHLEALRSLGADVDVCDTESDCSIHAKAPSGMKGTVVRLPYPSVGATENAIMASLTAKGTTVIHNAAIEPEVVELILYLQKMGAQIVVDTDRTISIHGTKRFFPVEHVLMTDRSEVAAFASLALATKGRIYVQKAEHQNMITLLNTVREVGGGFSVKQNGIEFFAEKDLKGGVHVETDVHPGFMTDWQHPFVVLLTQAEGASIVHETVFENRFGYVDVLRRMGAEISLFHQCLGGRSCRYNEHPSPHSIIVRGKTPLKGCSMAIPDLKAGFAYLMAALIAEGTSTITGTEFLFHTNKNIVGQIEALGGRVLLQSEESFAKL